MNSKIDSNRIYLDLFVLFVIASFICFPLFSHAQELVTKEKVIELANRFIQDGQAEIPSLSTAQFGEPELINDDADNPIKWQVKVMTQNRLMGYFYVKAETMDDGNIPVWFSGLGDTGQKQEQISPIKKEKGIAGEPHIEENDNHFIEEEESNFPKGQTTPRMGYSSLVFDPSKFQRIIPADDEKEIIEQEPPEAPAAWNTIKYESFEGSFPNDWDVYAATGYADAYWDDTSYKKYAGSWSGFCADLGSDSNGYGGQYVNNMYAWMIYGPFSLADATDAVVQFRHWTKTEATYDKLHYVASKNGTNYYGWYLTGNMTDDTGNINGWLYKEFDLTNVYTIGDLTGESQVWIAFVFTSDAVVVNDGSYLDEIYLKKDVGDTAPTLVDHFTCRDGNDPYNTATTTFNTTDNIAAEFVKFNSSSCTRGYPLGIDFYDDTNSYYWGATTTIPAGNSNYTWWAGIYISGQYPETHPGTYNARVKLDGSQIARDNFTIEGSDTEPTLVDHFTCRNGDDPYNTQTTTFNTTDAIATEFVKFNSTACTRAWTVRIDFFDDNDDFYWGAEMNLPAGNSSWTWWAGMYISGYYPATHPGDYCVRVHLDGNWLFRDDFEIVQQGGEPDIHVNPTQIDIYQTPANLQNFDIDPLPVQEEPFRGKHPTGLIIPEYVKDYWKTHSPQIEFDVNTLSASVDWSSSDSPVKNQGTCGSCWAFAAVGLVENRGGYSDLSEQVLVSCAPGDCNGGWMWDAFEYMNTDGVPPEVCYPYTATNGNCNNKCTNPDYLVKVTNYTPAYGLWGEPTTVNTLKGQLQSGPVVVAMRVPDDNTFNGWPGYTGGIYNYSGGNISDGPNHAVLLVGYNDDQQYFKAKNSWGTTWGESGYFRIAYDDVTDDIQFGSYGCIASGIYTEGGGESFTISNQGTATLVINSISDNKSWLSFTPTTIPNITPGGSQVVTVSVTDWNAVSSPSETGTITINSNDPDEANVQVQVTAYPDGGGDNPILNVNKTSMTFSANQDGPNPAPQTFNITNGGTGSFNWTVADNKSWLSESPTSGSTTNETDVVTVSVNVAGLGQGTYNGTITISAPAAQGSPKTINVTLNIGGGGPCNPPYVKAQDGSGVTGTVFTVDVDINQNPTAIDAFGFQFTYNSSKMSLQSVAKGVLSNHFSFFQYNESPAGTVTIGGFDTTPISENSNGTIARVTLQVTNCTEGETSTLGIQNLTDDLAGMNTCNGTFTCDQPCLLGDVNMDDAISPGDALCAFQIYLNGGTPPSGECDTECALYAADVNCSPNGVTPGDALYIFQAYLNGLTPPLDCDPTLAMANENSNNAKISLVKLQSLADNELKLALQVEQVNVLKAFGIDIGFSDEVLALKEVQSTTLTETWQALDGQENMAGVISIGGFNHEAISSNGFLATLTFEVKQSDLNKNIELWLSNAQDDLAGVQATANVFRFNLLSTDVYRIGDGLIPEDYVLDQNHPNPFNMETEITYQIPEPTYVKLDIYNSRGQKVKSLVSEDQQAGRYAVHWDGRNENGETMTSGVYLYRISTSKFVDSKKLILIK